LLIWNPAPPASAPIVQQRSPRFAGWGAHRRFESVSRCTLNSGTVSAFTGAAPGDAGRGALVADGRCGEHGAPIAWNGCNAGKD
jgi:hypothetical protein